jgi:hypothetical protein
MTTYEPVETRAWSTRELAALIGEIVSVSFRPDGGKPLPAARVADAGIGRFGQAWIEFEGGGSAAWDRNQISVTITVEGD